MKTVLFIKPDLTDFFNEMPAIGMWMQNDYNKAESKEDLAKLMDKWFEVSQTTRNATKEQCYKQGAHYLYSFLTNKSYESILNIEL